jgi:TRAP-type C4-dicarboxylate transport system permease small subunit
MVSGSTLVFLRDCPKLEHAWVEIAMKLGKRFETTARGLHALIRVLTWVASGALGMMILFVVINVLTRFLFKKPLPGSIEIIELVAVVIVFFSMAYTEARRGHIYVELVVSQLPKRTQAILASIMYLLAAAFFAAMGWRGGVLAFSYLFPVFRDTYVLSIPFAPFMFVIAFGSLVLALETLVHVFHPLPDEEGKEGLSN